MEPTLNLWLMEVEERKAQLATRLLNEVSCDLSAREQQVYEYLVRGCGIEELAGLLNVSTHTVRQHRKAVYRKLGVHGQVELMRYYG